MTCFSPYFLFIAFKSDYVLFMTFFVGCVLNQCLSINRWSSRVIPRRLHQEEFPPYSN